MPPTPFQRQSQRETLGTIQDRDCHIEPLLRFIHDLAEVEYNLSDLFLVIVLLCSVVDKLHTLLRENTQPIQHNPFERNHVRLDDYVERALHFYLDARKHQKVTRESLLNFVTQLREAQNFSPVVTEISNFNIVEDLFCYSEKVVSCRDLLYRSLNLIRNIFPRYDPAVAPITSQLENCHTLLDDHCWIALQRMHCVPH
jgi:hypothetical protein